MGANTLMEFVLPAVAALIGATVKISDKQLWQHALALIAARPSSPTVSPSQSPPPSSTTPGHADWRTLRDQRAAAILFLASEAAKAGDKKLEDDVLTLMGKFCKSVPVNASPTTP